MPSIEDKKKIPFFYLGPDNDWRKILSKDKKFELTDLFKNDLKELGYEQV